SFIGSVVNWVFNRVLCPSYQGFRIYRETLSRFWLCALLVGYAPEYPRVPWELPGFSHLS
ncbi:hypothetical protein ACT6QE_06495, partial [Staphylococcus aureus]